MFAHSDLAELMLMSEKVDDGEIFNLAWKKRRKQNFRLKKEEIREEEDFVSDDKFLVLKMPANGYTNGNVQHNACILVNGSQRKLSHSYLRYQRRYSKHGWESNWRPLDTNCKHDRSINLLGYYWEKTWIRNFLGLINSSAWKVLENK